jgi:PKD repeat protein
MKRFLLSLSFFLFISLSATAQTWQAVGSGLNSSTHGMCVWNSMLVDCGSFNSPCGRVAGWNGTTWACFGSGVGIVGRAAIEFNGNLVVCGDFWNVNQPCTGCNGIAMWNGVSWTPLGTGFNNDVLCMTVWNGELVAGGDFTTCDGNPCSRVARWTGTQWLPIGGLADFNNDIRTLCVYDGELWAGGDFTNVGGNTPSDRLVKWDGTNWVGGDPGVDIAGGVDSTVRVLYVDPVTDLLYMGGHFTDLEGNTAMSRVAYYDGSTWFPMGTGVDNYVRAITKYNGNIIVGGDFLNASGTPASKIAKWNLSSSTWTAMGTGMDDYVKSLEVWNGTLFAGGPFLTADGLPRACVAQWYEAPAVPPTTAFTMSDNTICLGECISLTDASTGSPTSWNWTFPSGTPGTSTTQNPTACWNTPGTYTITLQACNSNGCNSSTQTISVSSTSTPTVTLTSLPSATICQGNSTTLTASGATSYAWAPAAGLSATTGASVVANPTVTTTYTITGTSATCTGTQTITVTVNPLPTVNISPSSQTACPGVPVSLAASGAATYSWLPVTNLNVSSGANVISTPVSSITYTVTGTDANGCSASANTAITLGPSQTLPLIEGFESLPFVPTDWSLTDGGNDANTWQRNTSVGGFGTSTSCAWFPNNSVNAPGTRDDITTMSLDMTNLSVSEMTFDVAYCKRTSASGSDTLSIWVSTDCGANWTQVYLKGGATLATAPNQNSAFTPTAAQWRNDTVNLNAYAGNASVLVKFRNHNRNGNNLYLDNINITGANLNSPVSTFTVSSDSVCPGSCINFTDNSTFAPTSWNWTFNGAVTPTSTVQNPGWICWNTPGTYTVTLQACNSNGCNASTQTIVINPPPVVNAGSDVQICISQNIQLNASGGTGYSWSPSTDLSCANCPNPIASPTVSTTYVVTATDANTCSANDTLTVTVNPLPVVNAGSDVQICINQTTQLNASGGTTYSWNPTTDLSCANCPNPIASPTVTTTYVVTATDANSCSANDTVIVTIDLCMGVDENPGNTAVSVYPNPFSSTATIKVDEEILDGEVVFELYDVFGRIVMTQKITSTETTIRKDQLATGVYAWKLVSGSAVIENGQLLIE